jgi:hypothetical protein
MNARRQLEKGAKQVRVERRIFNPPSLLQRHSSYELVAGYDIAQLSSAVALMVYILDVLTLSIFYLGSSLVNEKEIRCCVSAVAK